MKIALNEKFKTVAIRTTWFLVSFFSGFTYSYYSNSKEVPPVVTQPTAKHSVHYAQLGVPETASFSSGNALFSEHRPEGDHLEYPLTFLCGCTFSWGQWGIADDQETLLEGKIYRVIHTPITTCNKRLWKLVNEVDAEGAPLKPQVQFDQM